MIVDVACTIASLILWCAIFVLHPTRAKCPTGWHANGIRPSGVFQCMRRPIGDDHRNARGILIDDSVQPPGVLESQIYCTGGTVPILDDDGATVGCQSRH